MDSFEDVPPDHRSGMVALAGRANVGKSSLVNRILDEKLSIVSPVAQTTRNVIRGVHTEPRGQIVFLDTPGVHQARQSLGKVMNKMARGATEGVDLTLLVFDSSTPPAVEDDGWIRRAIGRRLPCACLLHKQDLGGAHAEDYRALWREIAAEKESDHETDWLETSVERPETIDTLVEFVFARLPLGPLLFPADMLSDFPRKLAIADIVREKYFHELYEELPHSIGVWVQHLDVADDGAMNVLARVYVQKASHKGIVIGHRGRLVRKVKRSATAELEKVYEVPVKLDLQVKVQADWQENFFILKQLGYA